MEKINKDTAERIFQEDFIDGFDIPISAISTNDQDGIKTLIIEGIIKGRIEFNNEKFIVKQKLKIPIKIGKAENEELIEEIEYSLGNCNCGLLKPIQEKFEKNDQLEAIAFFTGKGRNILSKMCNSDAMTGYQLCAFFFLF